MALTVLAARQMSSSITAETVSTTTYTLAASDAGKDKRFSNAAAKTVTVAPTGTLGTDFVCSVTNLGAGALAFAPGSGVTLRKNIWKIPQYRRAIIRAIGTDEYIVEADVPDAPVSLTDGTTIATDCSLGVIFRVTLGGNRTLSNPTNGVDGKPFVYEITQDGTGSRTLAYDTKFRFSTDVPSPTLTTTANKTDRLTVIYNAAADKFDVVAVAKGS